MGWEGNCLPKWQSGIRRNHLCVLQNGMGSKTIIHVAKLDEKQIVYPREKMGWEVNC